MAVRSADSLERGLKLEAQVTGDVEKVAVVEFQVISMPSIKMSLKEASFYSAKIVISIN